MKTKKLRRMKAVTLTELLVVLAIIALLATIAVPVYINQMQRARVATAQMETREIAEALQHAAITHGFLVPIHVLDNMPNRDDQLSGNTNSQDDFDNMFGSGDARYVVDVSKPLEDQIGGEQDQLVDNSSNPRIRAMVEGWQGPFLNPKRVRYVGETAGSPGTGDITRDLVVDPWGNPYRVYSPFGLTGGYGVFDEVVNEVSTNMDSLYIPGGGGEQRSRFDRWAVLSSGPDGDQTWNTNNPLIQNDDIYYTFSVNTGNESKYQFF
jgi:prepilin-type N-terminal cleavage/methylation domain-containing protein